MVDIHIHHYHAAAAIKVLELHNKDYGAQVKPQKKHLLHTQPEQ